jgi:hypothetical protein
VPRIHRGYPGREAERRFRVSDRAKLAGGDVVVGPVHGIGQRRDRGAEARTTLLGTDINPEATRIAGERLAQFGVARDGVEAPRAAEI